MSVAIYNSTNIEYLKYVDWNYSQYKEPSYCAVLKKTQDAVDHSAAFIFNPISKGFSYITSLVRDYTWIEKLVITNAALIHFHSSLISLVYHYPKIVASTAVLSAGYYGVKESYCKNCKEFELFIESEEFLANYEDIASWRAEKQDSLPLYIMEQYFNHTSKLDQQSINLVHFIIKHPDIPVRSVNHKSYDQSKMDSIKRCLAIIFMIKIAGIEPEVDVAMTNWINKQQRLETEDKIASFDKMQHNFRYYMESIPKEVIVKLRNKLGFILKENA